MYRSIKNDVQLASISGGTDIVSCFALGCPTRPVHRGEIQCRGLGMAVDVVDEAGHALRAERGELVCTAPFPSMPVGFWNDPGDVKYRLPTSSTSRGCGTTETTRPSPSTAAPE